MKNTKEVKEAIKLLISQDFRVINGWDREAKVIWFAEEDIIDEGEGQYLVSDNERGEEYTHDHKTFDSAFKEFMK